MATPSFDEEAAERWYQSRVGVRQADPHDPMARFRNTSRSMFIDAKTYTGGALRGAVSDRRAEWMGGGSGGRLGEDWRQLKPLDVDRHGSGLDPFSYGLAKKIKGGVDKRRLKRASRRTLLDQTAKGDMEEAETVEPTPEVTPAVEPAATAKPKRTMTPEQRTKSNERRRALTAQRKDAMNILAAYSLGDETPEGPMWSGGPGGVPGS